MNEDAGGSWQDLAWDDVEAALRTTDPTMAVRGVVAQLISEGRDRSELLVMLTDFRNRLSQAGRESDEDVVLEVMDFLVGDCSPHMKL